MANFVFYAILLPILRDFSIFLYSPEASQLLHPPLLQGTLYTQVVLAGCLFGLISRGIKIIKSLPPPPPDLCQFPYPYPYPPHPPPRLNGMPLRDLIWFRERYTQIFNSVD